MLYQIRLKKSAEKELAKLSLQALIPIRKKIRALARNPFPNGYKKLHGFDNQYRVRQGNYRVINSIYSKELIIEILKVGHRRNIYE